MTRIHNKSGRRVKGFSLMEVLVALLVLSIGLLGLAGLQATGMSLNNDAYLRTQAVFLAHDMAERMRANQDVVGEYDGANTDEPPTNDCMTTGTGCTPLELVEVDIKEWSQRFSGLTADGEETGIRALPGGQGQISVSGDDIVISVSWHENDPQRQESVTRTFDLEFKL